ncbi:MAG TPA: hypothetical protein VNM66_09800, partial [Thermodesulfobacteriota bacterium]|nr:hypothetical protein [Thermodesulfobacteriota bacterium]
MTPRQRKWLTAAIVLLLALPGPVALVLRRTALQQPPRRVLPFDPGIWRAEAGRLAPEGTRGLMVPGLLASGRLRGLSEAEVRALLGPPDCPAGRADPFGGRPHLAYWVGRVGTRQPAPAEASAAVRCLYL